MLNDIFNNIAHTGNLHAKYFIMAITSRYTVNKCQTKHDDQVLMS